MPVNSAEDVEKLVGIVREVKPSLVGKPVSLDDSLVENLGLDSLDITQLARKVRRVFGSSFEPQTWATRHLQHKYSVRSLLDAAVGAPASEAQASQAQQGRSSNGSSVAANASRAATED